jgi:LCP family protein required for cell wall assembly
VSGHRTWPQRLFIALNLVVVVGLLATAAGMAYVYSKYRRLPRIELGAVLTDPSEEAGDARNVLIVGVDSAAGLDPDNPIRAGRERLGIGGLRSDTIIIVRIDPEEEKAALLSLPRDLWLPIAGRSGNQRINTAVNDGGPELLIATIEQYFDIPINNYLQVDFAGFQELVEAVGGVPVYFETRVRDRLSGLDVPEPGCVTLSPSQALAYARSRAFQYYDEDAGRWRTDPTGDLGRISRQQDFIRRALRRAVARGIRNPVTLDRVLDAALGGSVVVDDTLTADDLAALGNGFRRFNPDNLAMYSLPVVGGSAGGASIVRMVERDAEPILSIFRGVPTGELAPADVRVRVLNGSGRSGEAGTALADLGDRGFIALGAGEAESFDVVTTIVQYGPGDAAAAQLVARWLVSEPRLEEVPALVDGDVVVVTGQDWAGVGDEAKQGPPLSTTTSSTAPSTTSSSGSVTSSPTSSSTTTTIIGQVPEQPAGVSC